MATDSPFTPPPEMVEAAARALSRQAWERATSGDPERFWQAYTPQALAAIAVLAPMIAEECANVADDVIKHYPSAIDIRLTIRGETAREISAAIRSKFATGEKGK